MMRAQPGDDAVFGYRLAAVDETNTPMSLAVRILDETNKKPPEGRVSIRVKGSTVRPVRNRSGDYLFFRLVPGQEYTFQVQAELYEPGEITVKIPDHTGIRDLTPAQLIKNYIREIYLKPKTFL